MQQTIIYLPKQQLQLTFKPKNKFEFKTASARINPYIYNIPLVAE